MKLNECLPNLRYLVPVTAKPERVEVDICIYGGTSAGIVAAVQACRLGLKVALVELGLHMGGLTAGGLGATDLGNKSAIGGMARDFYRAIGKHYAQDEMWTFEPHVAQEVFQSMLEEAGVRVFQGHPLASVGREDGVIRHIATRDGSIFQARMFIDATYEGDLMAAAGVSYTVGREPNSCYRETLNGVQFGHADHNFDRWVDPYVVEGHPDSGLLPGVVAEDPGYPGRGDHCIQAYNFRMCLTDVPQNRLSFPKPAGYNPLRYELLLRYIRAGVWDALGLNTRMPNGKSDLNNHGGFSTDNIGRNYLWPEGSFEQREEIFQDHVNYLAGMLWFLCNDSRLPAGVREEAQRWGLPRDEYVATGGWTPQLYVREARRMVSDYVMTEHHCRGDAMADDPIGMAAYGMDSHHCRRLAIDGRVMNEGDVQVHGFRPYPISFRAIVPRQQECVNLLVPVCMSATHIAYGSIRMEPVFMILGQSASLAAALALEAKCPIQQIPYRDLHDQLLKKGQVLAQG